MAEGARLESVFTRKGNVGSNPTLSASTFAICYLRESIPAPDSKNVRNCGCGTNQLPLLPSLHVCFTDDLPATPEAPDQTNSLITTNRSPWLPHRKLWPKVVALAE